MASIFRHKLGADSSGCGSLYRSVGLSVLLLGGLSIRDRSGAGIRMSEKLDPFRVSRIVFWMLGSPTAMLFEEEQNPFAKYVDRDRATPPTWREEAQCVIFTAAQLIAEKG